VRQRSCKHTDMAHLMGCWCTISGQTRLLLTAQLAGLCWCSWVNRQAERKLHCHAGPSQR
jgi:hypothetical protein